VPDIFLLYKTLSFFVKEDMGRDLVRMRPAILEKPAGRSSIEGFASDNVRFNL
jgi:hypothetical protein